MRIIQFNSVGGASGDMLLGALVQLGADVNVLNRELASLLPEEKFKIEVLPKASYGINGMSAKVIIEDEPHSHHHHHEHAHAHTAEHSHHHRKFSDIRSMLIESDLPDAVKDMAVKVFSALAEAEGKIHGMAPDDVHFHEVGAVDSIVDITGCCLAMHLLQVDVIAVAPLPVGQGTMQCQHGIYPIPAPATTELLRGLQVTQTDQPYELVTPTGAALLSTWPHIKIPAGCAVKGIANSFGHRELNNRPNLLRAVLYEQVETEAMTSGQCLIMETNIDDSTPEIIGNAFNRLLEAGALDVWTSPIQMKNQRPAVKLTVLCEESDREKLQQIIFRETSTFGIREFTANRACLDRRFTTVETDYGQVRIKIGSLNGEDITFSPEMADCVRCAKAHDVPVKTVYNAALKNS